MNRPQDPFWQKLFSPWRWGPKGRLIAYATWIGLYLLGFPFASAVLRYANPNPSLQTALTILYSPIYAILGDVPGPR